MRKRPFIFAKLAVVLALLVAMAGTGFAHRILPTDIDESLQDYLAAGGSYADICGEMGAGHGMGETCDACRLVDSFAAPGNVTACDGQDLTLASAGPSLTVLVWADRIIDPARPVRAPPVV